MSFKCNQTKREVIWRVFVSVISDALGSDLVGRLKPPLRCKSFLLLNFVYMHHLLVSRTYRASQTEMFLLFEKALVQDESTFGK